MSIFFNPCIYIAVQGKTTFKSPIVNVNVDFGSGSAIVNVNVVFKKRFVK